jgi:hypothetical protein
MTTSAFAPSARAPGMAPGSSLPHPVHLCVGSLAASGPTKVVGCKIEAVGDSIEPTDLWGACGGTRSDRRDGDGKAPGTQAPSINKGTSTKTREDETK